MANRLSETGQDFMGAAAAFRDADFATTLQDSVQRMFEDQESLARTTESLTRTQLDWQTLAVR